MASIRPPVSGSMTSMLFDDAFVQFEIEVDGVTPGLFVRQLPLLGEVRTRKRPDDSKPADRS